MGRGLRPSSHQQAISKPATSQELGGGFLVVIVFASYSLRILFVFSWCFACFSPQVLSRTLRRPRGISAWVSRPEFGHLLKEKPQGSDLNSYSPETTANATLPCSRLRSWTPRACSIGLPLSVTGVSF